MHFPTELADYRKCTELLTVLQETDPSHLLGRAQLGTCHMRMKEYQMAGEVFSEVLKIEPDHRMALQNFGDQLCICTV